MLEEILQNNLAETRVKNVDCKAPFEEDQAIISLKNSINLNPEAAIVCEAKNNNPNYLSIIHANEKFYELFFINRVNLIGKSYDFLFADLDIDYSSDDQLEYVQLIRAVRDFHPCSVIISISDHGVEPKKIRLKITFSPTDFAGEKSHHAIFMFERIKVPTEDQIYHEVLEAKKSNVSLLKNLERTLRNERLLREVASLIISDLQIRDIAKSITKILCEHLKVDRCLIHDYHVGYTKFVVEYNSQDSKPMFQDSSNAESSAMLTNYINFKNNFYKKVGDKGKNSSLSIIEDVGSDYNFLPIRDLCKKFSIVAEISVTTAFNGKVNGGLYIHQSTERTWLSDEVDLIKMVADQFSIAIDRSDSVDRAMIANHTLMEKASQLKEALRKEQEMRKMQNEFVAIVSHEFKTPLQIIDSTRELLSRKIKNHNIADEGIDKALERIKSGIQRMNGLIHSTLNLAKMENESGSIKLQPENFDLKKFVLDIIEKNSNLALNKNIKLMLKLDELPAQFNGDPKLLDHAIVNIISNAIKYSRNDSTVKIFAKANDQKVALRVIDQGIGIPQEELSQVGQKFFRAKNTLSVAGTGIGLYLTKHFIELHGGEVSIESEINVGTSVTVALLKKPLIQQS